MGTGQNCPMPDASPARKPLSAPQKALHKLGLVRDIDLALHLPLRYEDETRIVTLRGARDGQLAQIEGAMPRLNAIPPGCAFNPRCPKVHARCLVERPEPLPVGEGRTACWLYDGGAGK